MPALYNEIDPYAAEWIENLERAGHIAPGKVDRRSIREVQPGDIAEATQFHAFAGIAVWSHALRLAGWPDSLPVFTGSCPCQPFSAAGKRKGFADDRHLWPEWFRLIRECRPITIFGEQVGSVDGRRWFDVVSADLEGLGYAVGAASLPACGVGAPQLRQRLFFVAYSDSERLDRVHPLHERRQGVSETTGSCEVGGVAHPEAPVRGRAGAENHPGRKRSGWHPGAVPCTEGEGEGEGGRVGYLPHEPVPSGTTRILGDSGRERFQKRENERGDNEQRDWKATERAGGDVDRDPRGLPEVLRASDPGRTGDGGTSLPGLHGATRGFWADAEWIPCRDGKARPVKRGSFPLAHGASGRMAVVRTVGQAEETHWYNRAGALKAIGNAIVPQVAATFVMAFMEVIQE